MDDDGSNNSSDNKTSHSSHPQPQQLSASSSIFACYTSPFVCGGGLSDSLDTNDSVVAISSSQNQNNNNNNISQNMRRTSLSRRADHLSSPRLRSRSQEGLRNAADEEEERILDQLAAEEFPTDNFVDSERVDVMSVRESYISRPDSVKSSTGSLGGGSGGFHRRAMSDPLDAQEETEESSATFLDSAQIIARKKEERFATLPRYPVQAQRNKNCWSEPPVSIFHVRGPVYFSDKKKVPSGQYLLPARGADLFLSETPVDYSLPSK